MLSKTNKVLKPYNKLDDIIDSKVKVKIARLFISRAENFKAPGREIANLIGVSAPAAHAALKELHKHNILFLELIGKQHIYRLNVKNRFVEDILAPIFKKESLLAKDVIKFIKDAVMRSAVKAKIVSIILYGSLQRGRMRDGSDVDVAVIIKNSDDLSIVEKMFDEFITGLFYERFGLHIDLYIKAEEEFIRRVTKKLSPVESLLENYSVIYGKDPLDMV